MAFMVMDGDVHCKCVSFNATACTDNSPNRHLKSCSSVPTKPVPTTTIDVPPREGPSGGET